MNICLYVIDRDEKGSSRLKRKKIVFTGGGTAGHVMVNLALIPHFLENGWSVDYIGSIDGIEKKLITQFEEVTYHPISTGKLRRYMSIENFKDPFRVLKGIAQAWMILRKLKPNIIFSKGGFVSVPVVMAAKLRKIPTIIHESDYTPGLANKLSIPFVEKVLTTFPETAQFISEKKVENVGAIVREELFKGKRDRGYIITGFNDEKPVLLVMGGSSGSVKVNTMIRNCLDQLLEQFQIIHICGEGNRDDSIHRKGYIQFEYVQDSLKDLLAITDFVISRAGSNAIFEFLALRIPMLLIPLSKDASRGDQIVNAESFQKQGYAYVLQEEQITEANLIEQVKKLKEYRSVILDRMQSYKREYSRERVIEMIENTYKK